MALPIAPNNQAIGSAMSAAPMSATPQAAQTSLPANYQDARNAFDQQRSGQISGPSLAVVGNDQFGQQFGYAADADAFDQFYNQNYANQTASNPSRQPNADGRNSGTRLLCFEAKRRRARRRNRRLQTFMEPRAIRPRLSDPKWNRAGAYFLPRFRYDASFGLS